MFEVLKEQVKEFPLKSGVYLMKNSTGKIIYVGKASFLRKRVGSYFTGNRDIKTRILVDHISDIEFIVTNNEYEALILEDSLIKKWSPRYNINLKDGKTYPVIRITNEDFPRVFRTRYIIEDGSDYFGPFTSAGKLDTYLNIADKLFLLRKCKGKLKKKDNPCLYYHIGRCSAPCADKISQKDYMKNVTKLKKLLSGDSEGIVKDLRQSMKQASRELNFEKAAEFRDLIKSVQNVGQQTDEFELEIETRDYISCVMRENLCTFSVFRFSEGRMDDRFLYRTEIYTGVDEALTEFFLHYYEDGARIPETIYLSEILDVSLLEEFLAMRSGKTVKIELAQKGKHFRILQMVRENAAMDIDKRFKTISNIEGLEELQKVLSLSKLPKRIEGFDISHLAGKHPVSSLVSFYNGIPDKKNYRKFHVKTLDGGIDDYESIREVVARRYSRVINDNLPKPDLIVIDGGKGQVNAAYDILTALGLGNIPVIGLAKRDEEIFLPKISEPIVLPETSEGLKVLQAVRDETHRFATGFNKKLREKDIFLSELEKIPGIGVKRSKNILVEFGSLENILNAGEDLIAQRAGLSEEAAENVIEYLKNNTKKVKKN
ncbi:MAG: excinuclease ABC subunit UvrC [Spirochaetia bacterium]|jgi:excinuclease ABC subunit C|nr:excinuclease ABC subunit UvrC [Spirochaetia bacterium]